MPSIAPLDTDSESLGHVEWAGFVNGNPAFAGVSGAVHLLARVDGRAVGTARLLVSGDSGKIGRVCVLAEMRGKGIGALLIEAAVREFAANPAIGKVKLSAQINALTFYERLGFTAEGDEYLDAGIVHRDMFRML